MSASATTDRGALSALGAFVSDELETAYRAGERDHDVRISRAIALLGVGLNVPFGVVDYLFQRQSALVYLLLLARLANVAAALLVYAGMPRAPSARVRDRLLLIWAVVLTLSSVPIVLARPPGFTGPLAMGTVLIAGFALVLPSSFRSQAASVALLVVGFLAARTLQGAPGAAAWISTIGVLAAAAGLTVFASLRLHRSKRELYLALHQQRTLRQALEGALAEIRTLRGIVPICAFCHKIRDEAGEWHRVETYVSERTHAEFSHGFCPTCEATHYPENA